LTISYYRQQQYTLYNATTALILHYLPLSHPSVAHLTITHWCSTSTPYNQLLNSSSANPGISPRSAKATPRITIISFNFFSHNGQPGIAS
jgi:hypothetical protein